MAWLWWLSGPVVATVLAACWSWWRARPKREPGTDEAMQAHRDFLDALAETPRSRDRGVGDNSNVGDSSGVSGVGGVQAGQ